MKTLEQLARAAGVPETKLKAQLKAINDHRVQLRLNGIGGRTTQRREAFYIGGEIPKWLWLHPELKDHYFGGGDEHERNKDMAKFYHDYPQFYLGGKL